jgi:hypothetical protein
VGEWAGQGMVREAQGRDSGWAAVEWVAEAVAPAQAAVARELVRVERAALEAARVRVAGACGSPAVAEADRGLVVQAEGQELAVVPAAGLAVEGLAVRAEGQELAVVPAAGVAVEGLVVRAEGQELAEALGVAAVVVPAAVVPAAVVAGE